MRKLLLGTIGGTLIVAMLALVVPSSTGTPTVPIAHAAAVDYFLKIDGVQGESTDDKHKGEIEIESWSWGASQPGLVSGGSGAGGGGGAGKVTVNDFHFSKAVDKASPVLMLSTATGQHFPKAVLTVRKAGGDQQEYIKITLTDVLISSYQVGGDQSALPVDSFSLNFAKIEYEYHPQRADGSLEAPVKAGYDVKANKKI